MSFRRTNSSSNWHQQVESIKERKKIYPRSKSSFIDTQRRIKRRLIERLTRPHGQPISTDELVSELSKHVRIGNRRDFIVSRGMDEEDEHEKMMEELEDLPQAKKNAVGGLEAIEFSSPRQSVVFRCYKEDSVMKFEGSQQQMFHRSGKDEDVDSDEETVRQGVEQCYSLLRKGLEGLKGRSVN